MDISVVMPVHNAAPYIGESLASIVSADLTGLSVEVIVVDDKSTDGTVDVVESIADGYALPFKFIKLNANVGCGAARAIAARHSSGRVVICVDADDLVAKHRFQDQMRVFDDHPGVMLCGGDVVEFNSTTGRRSNAVMFPTLHDDLRADVLFYCPIWGCSMAFRRDLLDIVPYPEVRVGDDWLFAFEVGTKGQLASTGKPATYYRRHEGQVTASSSATNTDVLWIWKHMLKCVGLEPTNEELLLHATCSPFARRNPGGVPELRLTDTIMHWGTWSRKLLALEDSYSRALRDRCARIQQTINACAHLDCVDGTVMRIF